MHQPDFECIIAVHHVTCFWLFSCTFCRCCGLLIVIHVTVTNTESVAIAFYVTDRVHGPDMRVITMVCKYLIFTEQIAKRAASYVEHVQPICKVELVDEVVCQTTRWRDLTCVDLLQLCCLC